MAALRFPAAIAAPALRLPSSDTTTSTDRPSWKSWSTPRKSTGPGPNGIARYAAGPERRHAAQSPRPVPPQRHGVGLTAFSTVRRGASSSTGLPPGEGTLLRLMRQAQNGEASDSPAWCMRRQCDVCSQISSASLVSMAKLKWARATRTWPLTHGGGLLPCQARQLAASAWPTYGPQNAAIGGENRPPSVAASVMGPPVSVMDPVPALQPGRIRRGADAGVQSL
jgi:hypothetical protein